MVETMKPTTRPPVPPLYKHSGATLRAEGHGHTTVLIVPMMPKRLCKVRGSVALWPSSSIAAFSGFGGVGDSSSGLDRIDNSVSLDFMSRAIVIQRMPLQRWNERIRELSPGVGKTHATGLWKSLQEEKGRDKTSALS